MTPGTVSDRVTRSPACSRACRSDTAVKRRCPAGGQASNRRYPHTDAGAPGRPVGALSPESRRADARDGHGRGTAVHVPRLRNGCTGTSQPRHTTPACTAAGQSSPPNRADDVLSSSSGIVSPAVRHAVAARRSASTPDLSRRRQCPLPPPPCMLGAVPNQARNQAVIIWISLCWTSLMFLAKGITSS
jgi:hypothetical protein